MTYPEFEHSTSEWCFPNGTIITADLTLVLSADALRDIVNGIHLEAVFYTNRPRPTLLCWSRPAVPTWLSDAMTAWVRDNQPALEVVRRKHFAEAAE